MTSTLALLEAAEEILRRTQTLVDEVREELGLRRPGHVRECGTAYRGCAPDCTYDPCPGCEHPSHEAGACGSCCCGEHAPFRAVPDDNVEFAMDAQRQGDPDELLYPPAAMLGRPIQCAHVGDVPGIGETVCEDRQGHEGPHRTFDHVRQTRLEWPNG